MTRYYQTYGAISILNILNLSSILLVILTSILILKPNINLNLRLLSTYAFFIYVRVHTEMLKSL